MAHDSFTIVAMIRGYRNYSNIWNAVIDEELPCAKESGNLADPFAVGAMKFSTVCFRYRYRAIADSIASYTYVGKKFSQVLNFAHFAHVRNVKICTIGKFSAIRYSSYLFFSNFFFPLLHVYLFLYLFSDMESNWKVTKVCNVGVHVHVYSLFISSSYFFLFVFVSLFILPLHVLWYIY